jgi:hypothetical protein
MLVFKNGRFQLDELYLGIIPLRALYTTASEDDYALGEAKCLFVYYQIHPKSPFREYSESKRPAAIIKSTFPKQFQSYDPFGDLLMLAAMDWYKNHLRHNPLHYAVASMQEVIYQFSDILMNPNATAADKKIAITELDNLPKKLQKLTEQAEKQEIVTDDIVGDRRIKKSERLPQGF